METRKKEERERERRRGGNANLQKQQAVAVSAAAAAEYSNSIRVPWNPDEGEKKTFYRCCRCCRCCYCCCSGNWWCHFHPDFT